jgi:hypothetical protein
MRTMNLHATTSTTDHTRYNMALKPQCGSVHGSEQDLSLNKVLALSKISSRSHAIRKIRKQNKISSKIQFVPDDQHETFEYETCSHDLSLKDQIWYNVSSFQLFSVVEEKAKNL